MSHDRKPGRVQVIQPGAHAAGRRRHDTAPVVVTAGAKRGGRSARGGKGASGVGIGGVAMKIALFLLATIVSAVATTLYLSS